MYSKFITSFSYMGSISTINPDIFDHSEKKELESSMGLNFRVIPTLDFPNGSLIPQSELGHDHHQENCGQNAKSSSSSFEIVIPSLKKDEDNEDGSRTPRSLDQRIPMILTCPLAPKKPKTLPSKKRKAPHHRNIMLHLSSEIQSLFPLVEDLGGVKNLKKAKQDFCVK